MDLTDINFQEAKMADIDKLSAMMLKFNENENYSFDIQTGMKNLQQVFTNQDLGKIWLILHQNALIGYVALMYGFSFEYKGRDAFIDEIYLIPKFQGLGIGSKVMQYVIEQASALKIMALHLEVEETNNRAIHIYTKHGFEQNSRLLLTRIIKQ